MKEREREKASLGIVLQEGRRYDDYLETNEKLLFVITCGRCDEEEREKKRRD